MSRTILVIGHSGSGKTTSMRNLDPKTTFYIDADKKGLSWKGWRQQYNAEAKNYFKSDSIPAISGLLKKINESKNIKTVIVDTVNGLMIADEMAKVNTKGYDKWIDLASSVYYLIDMANEFRDDLTVIFTGHIQEERDDSGYVFSHLKTSGRKLDKIVLESKFTTVLLSKVVDGKYIFETKAKNSTAKTPMGAFDTDTIDNDITQVIKVLEEY